MHRASAFSLLLIGSVTLGPSAAYVLATAHARGDRIPWAAAPKGDRLAPNQSLEARNADYLVSANGVFRLVMQGDCNLVLLRSSRVLWSSDTYGKGGNCRAVMQGDGNLVVYSGSNAAVWSSDTYGHPGAFAVLQDDGNLVVFQGQAPRWASGTGGQEDVASCRAGSTSSSGTSTVCRIDKPNVRMPRTDYPGVRFQPGDSLSVFASGCVQTGGSGSQTWKDYVYPRGNNSDRLYHGLIMIPGVTSGLVPIVGVIDRPGLRHRLVIPSQVPDPSRLFLSLGYVDDDYSDNGYSGHDNGNDDQCKGIGPAHVELTIWHRSANVLGSSDLVTPPALLAMDLWSPQIDDNWLWLNPKWGQQWIQPGWIPVVGDYCGTFYDRDDLLDLGHPPCTSQGPTVDAPNGWREPHYWAICNYGPDGAGENTVHGHINWSLATYTGSVDFSDYQVLPPYGWGDGDVDMMLHTPDKAGYTFGQDGIRLEFSFAETIANVEGEWWSAFRSVGEDIWVPTDPVLHGVLPHKSPPIPNLFDRAVVVGLIGIDNKHDAHVELHPVLGMFGRVAHTPTEEMWVGFARLSGGEGGCSQDLHDFSVVDERQMQFRLPVDSGVSATVASESWMHGPGGTWGTRVLPTGVLVSVQFGTTPQSDPTESLVWGVIHLHLSRPHQLASPTPGVPSNESRRAESRLLAAFQSRGVARRTGSAPHALGVGGGAGEADESLQPIFAQMRPDQRAIFADRYARALGITPSATPQLRRVAPRPARVLPRNDALAVPRARAALGSARTHTVPARVRPNEPLLREQTASWQAIVAAMGSEQRARASLPRVGAPRALPHGIWGQRPPPIH